jgi:hypothetical protein
MVFTFLAVALLVLTLVFLRGQKVQQRRVARQQDLPREQLLPRHYKSFTEIENELWGATEERDRSAEWDVARIRLRPTELQLVRAYVQGLREDFKVGNRICGVVIIHSPEAKILTQLEWQRLKIKFSYYSWYLLIRCRLWAGRISPLELRQLTEVVATLAYEVRSMLNAFEQSGNADFVESILKDY